MIYTSYFGNIKKIIKKHPDAGLISIAGATPAWFTGMKCKELMPHYDWWKEWHETFKENLESVASKSWYTEKYNETVLKNLDKMKIARKLKDLVEWKPTFILCYETPEKFCHRHLVADWFNASSIQCEEFDADA